MPAFAQAQVQVETYSIDISSSSSIRKKVSSDYKSLTSSIRVLTITSLIRTANETDNFEFKFKFKQLQVWNSERMSRGTRGARLHAPLIRFLHVTYTSDLISRSQCRANKASFVRTLSRFVAQLHRDSPGHLVRTSCTYSVTGKVQHEYESFYLE